MHRQLTCTWWPRREQVILPGTTSATYGGVQLSEDESFHAVMAHEANATTELVLEAL